MNLDMPTYYMIRLFEIHMYDTEKGAMYYQLLGGIKNAMYEQSMYVERTIRISY